MTVRTQIEIDTLGATEVLDSRGRPTLLVSMALSGGTRVSAGVPSGASTGRREAVERRDGDLDRFEGMGVQRAVMSVEGEIADRVAGRSWSRFEELDGALIDLDGTDDKGRLGANAVVGVSMAAARAFASSAGVQLHEFLRPDGVEPRLPVPHFNVINGGAHAQNELPFQEFMLAPLGAPNAREAIRAGAEIYGALRARLHAAGLSTGLGDEGGFAPEVARPEVALELIVSAIEDAGYEPGRDGVAIALDPAATGFLNEDGLYDVSGERLDAAGMIARYEEILARYPVWSIEDGLGEDDRDGWKALTAALGERAQIMGDDIFVTNPDIIRQAIRDGIGNSSLIKLNQIGTVTETMEALAVCRSAGYTQMISHRSGETADDFIADLAVASGCGQLKSGAPARGERVAKYNRLIAIEQETDLPYGLP